MTEDTQKKAILLLMSDKINKSYLRTLVDTDIMDTYGKIA